MSLFDWPITQKKKIYFEEPPYRNVHSKHKSPNSDPSIKIPRQKTLDKTYGTKWGAIGNVLRTTLGTKIWHKVRCYWEHVEEHIGTKNMAQSEVLLGTCWGTHWEQENPKYPPLFPLTICKKIKKLGPLGACGWNLIGCQEFFMLTFVLYYF
jgi:hypothetical protein